MVKYTGMPKETNYKLYMGNQLVLVSPVYKNIVQKCTEMLAHQLYQAKLTDVSNIKIDNIKIKTVKI